MGVKTADRSPESTRARCASAVGLAEGGRNRARRTRAATARPTRGDPDLAILATVAHEIRGPITALTTSSGLLAEDLATLDGEQVRGMLSAIHRRALWLQGLVETLLCAATIREGRLRLHREPLDLLQLIADTRSLVEPLVTQKRQTLRVRCREEMPTLHADGRRLGQVLVNLILNASKFGEPKTPIDVSLARFRDTVRVTVSDRGPGLPPESTERLFEPFYRSTAPGTCGKDGVGLGLSIVKSIVQAHDGRVGADNRKGGGARFWFELNFTPL